MFPCNLSFNILIKNLKCDRISSRRLLSLLKIIPELDEKVNEKIYNKEIKEQQHPGIIKRNCVRLPDSFRKAITDVVGSSRTQLIRECDSFAKYLHSRQLPVEKAVLRSKISSVKQDVEDSIDVNKDELSEEELEYFNKFVQFNTSQILKQRIYNWQPIIFTRHTGLKYLLTRAATEYAVITQIFKEILLRENFYPRTLFDFGSGVGTVAWAANETWSDSLNEIFCVDTSKDMIELSEELVDSLHHKQLKKKIFYRQFLPINPTYDIVVSAYSLMELPSAASRLETVAKLWNKTTRYLVLIEQGTMAGFNIISEARQFILDASKDETMNTNAHIFSPCPHDLNCPKIGRGTKSPCHFQISYNTYLQKEQIRKECYSYVVIKKGLRKPSDDDQWPRIVRPVLCRSKHVICRLCTSSGTLQEMIFTPTKHGRISYRCARKSSWGDRLPISIKYEKQSDDPIENIK